jgi:hypothetical protein
MKRIRLILCVVALFFFATSYGQNEKFKALFIYNYTKYIEWPKAMRSGDFVIGVYGNSPLTSELQLLASKQKVGSQAIIIKTFSTLSGITKCHILYIPSSKSSSIGDILTTVGKANTLVVTDREGLVHQGSGINFVTDGAKLNYEISKTNIEKQGLTVSNSLLTLGKQVN